MIKYFIILGMLGHVILQICIYVVSEIIVSIPFISQKYYVTSSIPFDVLCIFAYYVSSVNVGTFELSIDKYQRSANNDKACLVCHSNELRHTCTHPDVETGVKSRGRSINVYTICIQ